MKIVGLSEIINNPIINSSIHYLSRQIQKSSKKKIRDDVATLFALHILYLKTPPQRVVFSTGESKVIISREQVQTFQKLLLRGRVDEIGLSSFSKSVKA